MASRMLSAAPVPASAPLSRRTAPTFLLLNSPSLSPALGRKPLLGDPILRAGGASCPVPHVRRRRVPLAAAVLSMLPTSKPDAAASADKVPKWSARAIKSFCMAELEARKLKYPKTGTEALLMGILVEGTSLASKFLRANGIMLAKVREETVKLLGKSDMYFFSPEHPPLTEPAQRALDYALDGKLKSGKLYPTIINLCTFSYIGYCTIFSLFLLIEDFRP
ncbi:hypothetical protein Taro_025100, partial [Colocasia esculenta]|nr:hypothetical protein [Colocasia esculenta]